MYALDYAWLTLAYAFTSLSNTLLVMRDDTFRHQRMTQIDRWCSRGWLFGTCGVSSDVIIGTHSVLPIHLSAPIRVLRFDRSQT